MCECFILDMGDTMIDLVLLQLFEKHFTGQTPKEFKDFLKQDGYRILKDVILERFRLFLGLQSGRGRLIRLHIFFRIRNNEFLDTAD